MTLQELIDARGKALADYKSIVEAAEKENRGLSEEDDAKCAALEKEADALEKRIERARKVETWQTTPAKRVTPPMAIGDDGLDRPRQFATPRRSNLQVFKRDIFGEDHVERAQRMGMWIMACNGRTRAQQWCRENGYEVRLHQENVNTSGGYLVPDQIDGDLIRLVEEYGVFRQRARTVQMTSDHVVRRRRTGGVTAYLTGEGDSITESTMTFDAVTLTAKKWGVLSTITNELNEDSAVNIGELFAQEAALAFATKEDDCGFVGDGTSTYGGIVGLTTALTNLSGTIANIAGLFVGTGNAYSELVLTDFEGVVGKLPLYVRNAAWYASPVFHATVMMKLQLAAGGVTSVEIGNGVRQLVFLGYPVVLTHSMPKVEANSQVCALLGDIGLAADFGDRRMTTVAFSDSATVGSLNTFAADCIAVRATERFDINVHDVGNANATAASQVPGPVVGLITAAS